MGTGKESEAADMKNPTSAERTSDRELVVTRVFNGPVHIVFQAWTQPELLKQWWAPKSCGVYFVSCETDARTGGKVRFVMGHPAAEQPMAFFGTYLEVIPNARVVWTNEESADGSVTTVTFAEEDGKTRVTVHDLYPSKEALDAAIASGSTEGFPEQFAQLDELLAAGGDSV